MTRNTRPRRVAAPPGAAQATPTSPRWPPCWRRLPRRPGRLVDRARRGPPAPRDLPSLMRVFAARFQPHGENCVNETASGAAVWLPPGATFTPEDDARFETALVTAAPRRRAPGQLAEAMEAVHPSDPHHYLMLLGVVPARQGTGVGSALLRAARHRRRGRRAGLPRGDDAEPGAVRAPRLRGHPGAPRRGLPAPVGDVAGPGVTLKG